MGLRSLSPLGPNPSPLGPVRDTITRRAGEEKSGAEERIFAEGQLQLPPNSELPPESPDSELSPDSEPSTSDDAAENVYLEEILQELGEVNIEEGAEDVELSIDCTSWTKAPNGLLLVPEEHKQEVLRQCHDSHVAGHWGKHRTQELVSRNFTWDHWREDVAAYVASCSKCQKSKSDRHSRQTKLIPMPTGTKPWQEIAMDFVGELPESEGYNAILVITDRFTKMQHYIPALTTWTAKDVANAFICHIWPPWGSARPRVPTLTLFKGEASLGDVFSI